MYTHQVTCFFIFFNPFDSICNDWFLFLATCSNTCTITFLWTQLGNADCHTFSEIPVSVHCTTSFDYCKFNLESKPSCPWIFNQSLTGCVLINTLSLGNNNFYSGVKSMYLRLVSFLSWVIKASDDADIPDPVLDFISSILNTFDWMRCL